MASARRGAKSRVKERRATATVIIMARRIGSSDRWADGRIRTGEIGAPRTSSAGARTIARGRSSDQPRPRRRPSIPIPRSQL
jgi:hypothetical protein